jgi:hypothetical protein
VGTCSGAARAQQIGAGDKESAFTLRHGHDQTGIVVVEHEGKLENRFIIYRLCLGGGGKLSSPGSAQVAELTQSSIIIAGFS